MRCKRIRYIDSVYDGTTGVHTASFWIGRGWLCTCPSYFYRKRCKHLRDLLGNMTVYELDEILDEKLEIGRKFPSSLDVVDELFGDCAYDSNQICALYGKPKVGKTLFSIQEAVFLSSKGYNILFIDTEGSLIPMLRKWVPVLERRFGDRTGKIFVESKKSIETLMQFLGYKIALEYKMADAKKRKGKLEFRVIESIKSIAEDIIKEKKIDFIILDSLTSPIRSFTKEQQNFPARSDCIAFILREFVRLQEEYNVGVLVIHHATFNPQNPYETMANASGGVIVHYYCKRFMYLDRRDATAYKDFRRFWLVRGENIPEWSRAVVAKIDNRGYHSVKDGKILSNVFTLSEKSKIGL